MAKIDITPSTDVLNATERTGYDWHEAAMEIVDNCADAIRRRLNNSKKKKGYFVRIHALRAPEGAAQAESLRFIDNGDGINREFLRTGAIFSLGRSHTRETNTSVDATGAFGMGLKTAAQTLGTSLTVLTTTTDVNNLIAASVSWDTVKETGEWQADFLDSEDISSAHRKIFKQYIKSGSGTIIIIDNVNDRVPTVKALYATLHNKIAHSYRHILNPDSTLGYHLPMQIQTGQNKITTVSAEADPLCVMHDRTNILIGGDNGEFKEYEYNGYKYKVRLTQTKLAKGEQKTAIEGLDGLGAYQYGVTKQGAYFIRNGREIHCGTLWQHSSTAGNLFAEIAFTDDGGFSAGAQSPIRTDYGKKGIVMDDDFKDHMLRTVFNPFVRRLAREAVERAKSKTKGSRDEIMNAVAKTPGLSAIVGRDRNQSKQSTTSKKLSGLIKKNNNKTMSNTNAKYRGTSINAGDTDIDIEWEEQVWYGSDFAYNINYTAGDPVVKIQLNIEHDWIRKNIYLETDGEKVTKATQQIAASVLPFMYEDDETRERVLLTQSLLLNTFEDDFGKRIESELANVELEPTIFNESTTGEQQELFN